MSDDEHVGERRRRLLAERELSRTAPPGSSPAPGPSAAPGSSPAPEPSAELGLSAARAPLGEPLPGGRRARRLAEQALASPQPPPVVTGPPTPAVAAPSRLPTTPTAPEAHPGGPRTGSQTIVLSTVSTVATAERAVARPLPPLTPPRPFPRTPSAPNALFEPAQADVAPPPSADARTVSGPQAPSSPQSTSSPPTTPGPATSGFQIALAGGPDLSAPDAPVPDVVPLAPRHHAPSGSTRDDVAPRDRTLTLLLVGVLLLVVAIASGVVWLLRSQPSPTTGPVTVPPATTQQTLYAALADPGGHLVAGTILAVGADSAVSILTPSRLLIEVPGAGRRELADAFATASDAPAKGLADALQVRIDGTWILSTTGLASLVDAAGGVVVDVDHQLTEGTLTVAAGAGQHLDGAQAALVASARAPDEPEEARLARFNSVLSAVLASMKGSTAELTQQLGGLGAGSRSTLPAERLSAVLYALHARSAASGLSSSVLPVTAIGSGADAVFGLDEARAAALVKTQLPGALVPPPDVGTVRVLVRNGVGTPGLSQAAHDRIVAAGLRFVAGGNAEVFGQPRTSVLVASDSPADLEKGRRVAAALGVPAANVAVDALGSTQADVFVILGQDFADDVTDHGVQPSTSTTP